ncbi:MAG: methionine--tRNA ligase, partial [Planctomycetota bacterium]|nr:methionine--tRNA ligase [Planctomycetota bacterium]
NQYIDEKKPWQLAKVEGSERDVHEITSLAINLFKVLMTYLKPVLPEMAKRSEEFLNIESLVWPDIETPLTSHKINNFKPLMTRIEDDQIDQMVESSRV